MKPATRRAMMRLLCIAGLYEDEIRSPSVADVLALHAEVMAGMGHSPAPLRDPGTLESAVLKPQTAADNEGADLVRQAALPATGISQAQAFIDGTEPTASIAAPACLRANGRPYAGGYLELAQQLEAVALRTDSLEAAMRRFQGWRRLRVGPAES